MCFKMFMNIFCRILIAFISLTDASTLNLEKKPKTNFEENEESSHQSKIKSLHDIITTISHYDNSKLQEENGEFKGPNSTSTNTNASSSIMCKTLCVKVSSLISSKPLSASPLEHRVNAGESVSTTSPCPLVETKFQSTTNITLHHAMHFTNITNLGINVTHLNDKGRSSSVSRVKDNDKKTEFFKLICRKIGNYSQKKNLNARNIRDLDDNVLEPSPVSQKEYNQSINNSVNFKSQIPTSHSKAATADDMAEQLGNVPVENNLKQFGSRKTTVANRPIGSITKKQSATSKYFVL